MHLHSSPTDEACPQERRGWPADAVPASAVNLGSREPGPEIARLGRVLLGRRTLGPDRSGTDAAPTVRGDRWSSRYTITAGTSQRHRTLIAERTLVMPEAG